MVVGSCSSGWWCLWVGEELRTLAAIGGLDWELLKEVTSFHCLHFFLLFFLSSFPRVQVQGQISHFISA